VRSQWSKRVALMEPGASEIGELKQFVAPLRKNDSQTEGRVNHVKAGAPPYPRPPRGSPVARNRLGH
jgi:hypothetical protein